MEKFVKRSDGYWANSSGVAVFMLVKGRPVEIDGVVYNEFKFVVNDFAPPVVLQWTNEIAVVDRGAANWLIGSGRARLPQDAMMEEINSVLGASSAPVNKDENNSVADEKANVDRTADDKADAKPAAQKSGKSDKKKE